MSGGNRMTYLLVVITTLVVNTILATLATDSCGIQDPSILERLSNSDRQEYRVKYDRIVGGTEANPAEYPWMVSIARRVNMTNSGSMVDARRHITMVDAEGVSNYYHHICGGSLITKDWLMTAAHCLYNPGGTEGDYLIWLGNHKLYGPIDANRPDQTQQPTAIIFHPRYDPDRYDYDIGLMKLASPITKFTTRINTVCLSAAGESPPPYTNCTVSGWGRTNEDSPSSPVVLRKVDVKILPDSNCSYMLPGMVCAGVIEGGKGPCMGDSGGPLVYGVNTNDITRYYQAGIVSFGKGCARPNNPGVYADVGFFLDWIKEVIKGN